VALAFLAPDPLRASGRRALRQAVLSGADGPRREGRKPNGLRPFAHVACIVLSLVPCALVPRRASAQGTSGPLANVPKLLQVLKSDGFETLQGRFQVLDAVANACGV